MKNKKSQCHQNFPISAISSRFSSILWRRRRFRVPSFFGSQPPAFCCSSQCLWGKKRRNSLFTSNLLFFICLFLRLWTSAIDSAKGNSFPFPWSSCFFCVAELALSLRHKQSVFLLFLLLTFFERAPAPLSERRAAPFQVALLQLELPGSSKHSTAPFSYTAAEHCHLNTFFFVFTRSYTATSLLRRFAPPCTLLQGSN